MAVYTDPSDLAYDGTSVTGCKSITADSATAPASTQSDAGELTHFVVAGGVSGVMEFEDPDEAAKIAARVAGAKNVTFSVKDQADAAKTVTIANFKSGGVSASYVSGRVAAYTVPYVADSISAPAA